MKKIITIITLLFILASSAFAKPYLLEVKKNDIHTVRVWKCQLTDGKVYTFDRVDGLSAALFTYAFKKNLVLSNKLDYKTLVGNEDYKYLYENFGGMIVESGNYIFVYIKNGDIVESYAFQ